jgi:hypothetical protein
MIGALLLAALTAALACPAAAQNADAPRAPRIIGTPPAPVPPPSAAPVETREPPLVIPDVRLPETRRPPNAARLAPLPGERTDGPEEIIVIGQGWRLPDLGSEWRAKQKEAQRKGRFSATALPLYDPNEPPLFTDVFATTEQRRHGYIELFRLRFGRRSRD